MRGRRVLGGSWVSMGGALSRRGILATPVVEVRQSLHLSASASKY